MAKLTLADVSNILGNPTSAQTTINNNSRLIETALENTLSRDGTTPNQMNADIDMNDNDILNVKSLDVEELILDGDIVGKSDVPLTILTETIEARDQAQAWAEGTLPGGPGTKSAKEWAEVAGSQPPPDGSVTTDKLANSAVTIAKVDDSVLDRIIEFDIRDPRFAGGAPWNGVDDDAPAFAAAIAYFKTLNTSLSIYVGKGAARLRLPRGTGVLNSSVDLTAAHNVHIIGEGDGATTIRVTGNFPAFKSDSTTTTTTVDDSHHRVGLADFCIVGPGRANTNAHGVDFQAMNNGFIRDVRFYSLRDAIRMRNAWQFDITRPKIDGGPTVGGGLTCYRGIALLDGLNKDGTSNNVIENGVKIYGGIISGCENVGFRGESVSGSMVMGLEVLACGQTGVLLGDNPGGKPTKWFTWTGGMIDTCGDLLVIQKGNSSEATEMHFSGLWMGYANAGSGNGDAIRLEGVTKSTFRPDMVANVDTALVAVNCTGITYEAGTIDGYDRSLVGSTGIILENTVQSKVSAGRATKWPGSPSTIFIAETGSCDFNTITDINCDGGATIIGPVTIGGVCRPFKFKNNGGVDILSGASTVVVNHGLVRAPNRGEIQVTPRSTLSTSGVNSFAVDTITSTQFTIRTNANVTANTAFDWFADVTRG